METTNSRMLEAASTEELIQELLRRGDGFQRRSVFPIAPMMKKEEHPMTLKERTDEMVSLYGEVCKRADAARILHVSSPTINSMLSDGRLEWACEGQMVDMRSIARYICMPAQIKEEARKRRYCRRNKVKYCV